MSQAKLVSEGEKGGENARACRTHICPHVSTRAAARLPGQRLASPNPRPPSPSCYTINHCDGFVGLPDFRHSLSTPTLSAGLRCHRVSSGTLSDEGARDSLSTNGEEKGTWVGDRRGANGVGEGAEKRCN